MRVWDDYCEVWNEGELPYGFTPETLLEQHSSRPRNKNIAFAFFKAGFIDAWGRGYKKIREGFEAAGLPMPKIESAYGGVRVTFQRNNVNRQIEKDAQQATQQKMQQETQQKSSQKSSQKVIELIQENPRITTTEMADSLGITRRAIAKITNTLQTERVIRRVGPDKGGHWEIIEDKES